MMKFILGVTAMPNTSALIHPGNRYKKRRRGNNDC